jgi:hypothetical protein
MWAFIAKATIVILLTALYLVDFLNKL